MSSSEPDYVARNIEEWTRNNAAYTDGNAEEAWSRVDLLWGVFAWPESELRALPDVSGMDVCELGCGTAYVSAWLARQEARPIALDVTPAQLETARRMQESHGLEFPLVEASAEQVPLPDGSFDLVVSEHGASTWCDPARWIPEAARLLRPGGWLVFMHTHPLADMCWPEQGPMDETLKRSYFGLGRQEWEGQVGVAFQIPHSRWIELLRGNGLTVERLLELQAPADAAQHGYYDDFDPEWCRKWPGEEIWVARKT
jgi:SAM-dependent methyltransferase